MYEMLIRTCGAMKKVMKFDQHQKLMKFVMHSSESYDDVRGQLLLTKPLLIVNQAYPFVQEVKNKNRSQVACNVLLGLL